MNKAFSYTLGASGGEINELRDTIKDLYDQIEYWSSEVCDRGDA